MRSKLKFLLCLILFTTALKSDLEPCALITASTKQYIYEWWLKLCPHNQSKIPDCIKYYDVGEDACYEKTRDFDDRFFKDC